MKYAHLIVLSGALLLGGCSDLVETNTSHAHLTSAGNREYYPDPGYKWDHPGSGDLLVHWMPGIAYWNSGSNTYPHIVSSRTVGRWYPDAGYVWSQPDDANNLSVFWSPGSAYADEDAVTKPHIVASDTQGEWLPAAGYVWAHLDAGGNPIAGDLVVKWTPGAVYRSQGRIEYPHIVASDTPGRWWPEPGYRWAHVGSDNTPTDLAAAWTPGMTYRSRGEAIHPHLNASTNEGSWFPEPGYRWTHVDVNGSPISGDLDVHWEPGIKYWYMNQVKYPNIVSNEKEGEWLPAKGYAWANGVAGDLTVVAAARPSAEVTRATVAEDLPASTSTGAPLGAGAAPGAVDKGRK